MDKIVCFGKNYQDHMLELGDSAVKKPVIFLKPPSVLKQCVSWGSTLIATHIDAEIHYECELVLKLAHGGYLMNEQDAKTAIAAYTIGLDMTLRKEQALLKASGHPWTTAKVFPDACIIGPWLPFAEDFLAYQFNFTLDNQLKQSSCGQNMLFKPTELIAYASQYFPLCTGDILFTGTPAGVGAINNNSLATLQLGDHRFNVKWTPRG